MAIKIFYICDGKECKSKCCGNDMCIHTSNIEHSKYYIEPPTNEELKNNFEKEQYGNKTTYWEKEAI